MRIIINHRDKSIALRLAVEAYMDVMIAGNSVKSITVNGEDEFKGVVWLSKYYYG